MARDYLRIMMRPNLPHSKMGYFFLPFANSLYERHAKAKSQVTRMRVLFDFFEVMERIPRKIISYELTHSYWENVDMRHNLSLLWWGYGGTDANLLKTFKMMAKAHPGRPIQTELWTDIIRFIDDECYPMTRWPVLS